MSPTSTTTAPGPSPTQSLARGGMVLTAAGLFTGLANYATNATLARSLDAAGFGDAALAVTFMLATTGLAAIVQLVTAQRVASTGAAATTRRFGLRVGAAAALALGLAAPLFADLFKTDGSLIFTLLALGLPFQMVLAVERGTLQGRLRFVTLAATFAVEGTLRLLATVIALQLGVGAGASAIGISVSLAIASLFAIALSRHTTGAPATPTMGNVAPIAATAALLAGQIVLANADLLIVKYGFVPEAAGAFALAALAGRAFHFVAAAITNTVFPVVAAAPHTAGSRRIVVRAVLGLSALGILATTIAWGFADGIVQALGAGDESVAAELVGPYVLATALLAIAHLLAAVDVAAGGCRAAHIMVAAGVLQAAMVIAAAHDVPAVLDIRIGVAAVLVAVQARRSLRPTEVSS